MNMFDTEKLIVDVQNHIWLWNVILKDYSGRELKISNYYNQVFIVYTDTQASG